MPRASKKLWQGTAVFICLVLWLDTPFEILWLLVSRGERTFRDLFMTRAGTIEQLCVCQKRVFLNDTLQCFVFFPCTISRTLSPSVAKSTISINLISTLKIAAHFRLGRSKPNSLEA